MAPQLSLRPATPDDRRPIFEWMTLSDITHFMLGPPHFPDCPASDWEEFCEDYLPHFFDGSAPEQGRCFVIEVDGMAAGQINHGEIVEGATELDIWMRSSEWVGKGYGTEAIRELCRILKEENGVEEFRIAPSERNVAALKAYEKVGFLRMAKEWEGFQPDFEDAVPMCMRVE